MINYIYIYIYIFIFHEYRVTELIFTLIITLLITLLTPGMTASEVGRMRNQIKSLKEDMVSTNELMDTMKQSVHEMERQYV